MDPGDEAKQLREMQATGVKKALLEGLASGSSSTTAMARAFNAPLPSLVPIRLPTAAEANAYQSAGWMLQRLADSLTQWKAKLLAGSQPAILALLNGNISISVSELAEESFHGIRISGMMEGKPCMVLSHQSSVQLLCFVEEVSEPPRPIGFVIAGKSSLV